MPEEPPLNPNDRPTMAYADGELDPQASIRVVEQMAEDPLAAKAVLHQQQLRAAVGRVMEDPSMRVPDGLRSSLRDLAATVPSEPSAHESRPAVIGRIGFWVPAAVAACLLVGVLVSIGLLSNPGLSNRGYAFNDPLISSAQVGYFTDRHNICANSPEALMADPNLPQSIADLPDALRQRFGNAPIGLDLAPLGYTFAGAGPCNVPGSGSVHLVYQPLPDSGHDGPISLWIRPSNPDLEIEPDRLYQVNPDANDHPILLWRAAGLDYWLVGESPADAQQVADRLIQRL